ncbi:MAG: class I SAM-dependent methyltransferase [Flavipsychrobacter sp.]|nr:class I SAM-dependent methyltransferase [Flavipsychrobacter sp.]
MDSKRNARALNSFEELYINAREKEQRIYTDAQLLLLPDIAPSHPHYKEWLVRKHSSVRLIKYLKSKRRPLSILEIGCGNGWLSARLSEIENATVTGLDINQAELTQASTVFKKSNLQFIYGNIADNIFPAQKFDVVVFAASLQYFPSLTIFNSIFPILCPQGAIHIIDTPFYKPGLVAAARERTRAYYTALHVPEMADRYYHHSVDELKKMDHTFLYDPNSFINKLLKRNHPFPWVVVRCQ